MTIGEKIRTFRSLKKMSRKAMAERSGVSEIAIRKYEEGTRNPKPAQLKKIARALELNETVFLEIPLNMLNVETIGEAMALILLLEDRVGFFYKCGIDENDIIVPSTITIHFKNETINKYLARLLTERGIVESRAEGLKNAQGKLPAEDIEQQLAIDSFLLETSKQEFMEDTEPLSRKK